VNVSITGALELADAWDEAEANADRELKQVVSKGALNVKRDWARRWTGLGPHLPHLPSTVGYDLDSDAEAISADIGPDTDKLQGAFAHMIELGSQTNAPHPGGQPALDAEAPRFETAAGDAGEKLADV
jgi:hypothetical protein